MGILQIRRWAGSLAAFAVSLFIFQAGAFAAYPKLEWTFRVKPDVAPGSVVFVEDAVMAAQGERNQLRFIDTATGNAVWSYALDERAELFPLGNGSVLAVAGNVIHRLDYAAGKRVWSMPVCDPRPAALYLSADSSSVAVDCPGSKDVIYSLADGAATKSNSIPRGAKLLSFAPAADFNPSLLGEDSTLNIQGKKASLYTGKVQSVSWTYDAPAPLSQTAALLDNKLLLVSASGVVAALDPASGKELYTIDLKKIIDMRFWDELPHKLDNYSAARLFTHGGALYLLPPSGVSKIKILAFPPQITLGGGSGAGSGDTTQQWALNKAIQAWDRNDFTAALKGFNEASQIWPGSPEVLMFMGMAYSALREANPAYLDQAVSELERALAVNPQNPDVVANLLGNYMLKALSLDQRADRDKIIALYKKMIAADPLSLAPYAGLAETYISEGDFAAAVDTMRESFSGGFFGADQLNLLASAYYLQDDRASALEQADKTTLLYPGARFPYILKGKIFCKDGRYAKAAAVFAAAPPDSPPLKPEVSNYPRLLMAGSDFFEGNALGLSGRYPEAIKKLSAFAAWLPAKKQLEDYKKKMYGDARNKDGAAEVSLEIDGRFKGKSFPELTAEAEFRIPAMLTLAHFYYRTGKKAESLKQLAAIEKLAAEESPDNDTLSYVGYYYALNGKNLDRAVKYTQQALKANAQDAVYGKNYAVALWKSGRKEEAEKAFKDAIALGAPTEFLRLDYGTFLLESNRREEAAAQFKKELELAPDMHEAKIALEKIAAPPKSARRKTAKAKLGAAEKPKTQSAAEPNTEEKAPDTKFIIPKTPKPSGQVK